MQQISRIAWAVALVFTVLLAVSSLWWPFGRDQGIFAWAGDEIVHGGMPYKDAWEQKGPAVHYIYALSQILFGRNMWGIRLLDLLLVSATGLAIALAWGARFGRTAGMWAAVLFALWHYGLHYWSTAQPDNWAGMLIILTLLSMFAWRRNDLLTRSIIPGVLIGICTLLKPLFGVFLLVPLAAWVLPREDRIKSTGDQQREVAADQQHQVGGNLRLGSAGDDSQRRDLASTGLLAALSSFFFVIVVAIVWFAARGALDELLEIQFVFNPSAHLRATAHSLARIPVRFIAELVRFHPYLCVGVLTGAIGLIWLWRTRKDAAIAILITTGLALFCVLVQGKFYPYHYAVLYGPVALLSGIGLAVVSGALRASGAAILGTPAHGIATRFAQRGLLAVLLILTLGSSFAADLYRPRGLRAWLPCVFGERSWRDYYAEFGDKYGEGDLNAEATIEAAQYVRSHTQPQDRVLVWGFEPGINFLSGRQAPSRYGFYYPLIRPKNPELRAKYAAEFLRDLESCPPRYIVIVDQDQSNLLPKTSAEALDDVPDVKRWIMAHYELESTIEHFAFWRRVDEVLGGYASR